MKIRNARKLRDTLLILGFVIMLASYLIRPLFIVGLLVALSCLIPDILYNKCPKCEKHLGRNEGSFCQHCGAKID